MVITSSPAKPFTMIAFTDVAAKLLLTPSTVACTDPFTSERAIVLLLLVPSTISVPSAARTALDTFTVKVPSVLAAMKLVDVSLTWVL